MSTFREHCNSFHQGEKEREKHPNTDLSLVNFYANYAYLITDTNIGVLNPLSSEWTFFHCIFQW